MTHQRFDDTRREIEDYRASRDSARATRNIHSAARERTKQEVAAIVSELNQADDSARGAILAPIEETRLRMLREEVGPLMSALSG